MCYDRLYLSSILCKIVRHNGGFHDHHLRTQNHCAACIDFYDDFLAEGGKFWPWVEEMGRENNLLDNLRTIVHTAREAGITVYHVPHHRWEQGDYVDWKYPSPYQLGAAERQAFAKDTWGGTFHPDSPIPRFCPVTFW